MACFLGSHQQGREWDSVDVEQGHGPDRSSLVLWTSPCMAIVTMCPGVGTSWSDVAEVTCMQWDGAAGLLSPPSS